MSAIVKPGLLNSNVFVLVTNRKTVHVILGRPNVEKFVKTLLAAAYPGVRPNVVLFCHDR